MPSTGTRKSFVAGLLLAALVLLGAAPARALDEVSNAHVSIVFLTPDAHSQRLFVSGTWPTPCVPESASVSRSGQDLRVETRSRRSLCARQERPFRFEIDPRERLGKPLEPGVYRVAFYAANAATGPTELRGFSVISVDLPTVAPEAGFWWPEHNAEHPQESAQGMALSLETQGNTLAASLLTYAEDGHPTWYFGTGTLQGRAGTLALQGMRDGPGLFGGGGRMPAIDQTMDLKLEFLGGGRLTAWLGWHELGSNGQPVLRLQPITFARQSLRDPTGPTTWMGEWLLLRGDGAVAPVQHLSLQENRRLDAEHFQLVDPAGWTLTCHQAPSLVSSPPDSCVLAHRASGEDIDLDNVGIARSSGRDRSGAAVSLIRPPH